MSFFGKKKNLGRDLASVVAFGIAFVLKRSCSSTTALSSLSLEDLCWNIGREEKRSWRSKEFFLEESGVLGST